MHVLSEIGIFAIVVKMRGEKAAAKARFVEFFV